MVCKVETKEMLPKDLYSKWDDGHNHEAETDAQNDDIQGPKITQTMRESMSTVRNIRKQSRPCANGHLADEKHGR